MFKVTFFCCLSQLKLQKNDCLGLSFIRKKLFTLLQCYVCQIKTHFAYRIIGLDRAAATWSLLPASMLCPVCASMWPLCEYWLCHVILFYSRKCFYAFAICACLSTVFFLNCASHVYMSLPPLPLLSVLVQKGKME